MKLSLKQKVRLVLVFPIIGLIWMVGWSLYWIGEPSRKKDLQYRREMSVVTMIMEKRKP